MGDIVGFESLRLQGRRVLFVASSGGHLSEMQRVASRVGAGSNSALVTFPGVQADGVTWIDDVRLVPYIRPRGAISSIKAVKPLWKILHDDTWDAVVSTGAAIAVACLPTAAAMGIRSVYIESYARFDGPSATGKLLAASHARIELLTQHRGWAGKRWQYRGSVMDSFASDTRESDTGPRRYFVTLGTIEPYRFDSVVDAVKSNLPESASVVWQLGCTTRSDLPGRSVQHLSVSEFADEVRKADFVVSHAGVGTAMQLIEMGHKPLLVPRRAHRNEHVDDHQLDIAADLSARGLVTTCDSDELASHPHFLTSAVSE